MLWVLLCCGCYVVGVMLWVLCCGCYVVGVMLWVLCCGCVLHMSQNRCLGHVAVVVWAAKVIIISKECAVYFPWK